MCQNISKEVLLSSFKNQAKIHSQDRKGTFIQPPCIKKGLRNSNHSMSMVLDTKKSNFGNQQFLRFHIWFIMARYYKNATPTTCDNMRQGLLQNATVVTKRANFITKCDNYYKIRRYR